MRAIAIVLILGCGAGAPPAKSPASGLVEPTSLSAAERQRDAARTPLAVAAVDAYANVVDSGHGFVARWSPDGGRIVYGSLRDGVPALYAGDPAAPAAAPRALTVGPERALAAQYTPDGRAVVFLRDTGGDENYAIWRVDADGSHPTNLTPGEPMHRSEPMIRGDVLLYSAARTSAPDTMVFRQRLAGGAPEQITRPIRTRWTWRPAR